MNPLTLKPIGDRLLVKAVKPDTGKIVIPEAAIAKDWSVYQVVRLGTKREKGPKCAQCGHKTEKPFDVKPGDVVSLKPYAGVEFKVDREEYRIVTSDELMGVYQ